MDELYCQTVANLWQAGSLISCQESDAFRLLSEISVNDLRIIIQALGMDSIVTGK